MVRRIAGPRARPPADAADALAAAIWHAQAASARAACAARAPRPRVRRAASSALAAVGAVIARLEGVLLERAPTRVADRRGRRGLRGLRSRSRPSPRCPTRARRSRCASTRTRARARSSSSASPRALERVAFELLLRASRVGPRLAQTILSGIDPAELLARSAAADRARCAPSPASARSSPSGSCVELRDRVDELALAVRERGAAPAPRRADAGRPRAGPVGAAQPRLPARRRPSAWSRRRSESRRRDADVETWVRAALRRLAR